LLINLRKCENRARVHFIPNLKVGVFVTLRAPDVIKTGYSFSSPRRTRGRQSSRIRLRVHLGGELLRAPHILAHVVVADALQASPIPEITTKLLAAGYSSKINHFPAYLTSPSHPFPPKFPKTPTSPFFAVAFPSNRSPPRIARCVHSSPHTTATSWAPGTLIRNE